MLQVVEYLDGTNLIYAGLGLSLLPQNQESLKESVYPIAEIIGPMSIALGSVVGLYQFSHIFSI